MAKGLLTAPDQLHISFVHALVRYAWDPTPACSSAAFGAGSVVLRWQLHALRQWEQLSAQRVDHLIANSRFTVRRIRKY